MTALINVAIAILGVLSIALGAQASFAPREGHTASLVSFIAGGAIGVLLLASIALWKKNPRAGRIMAAILSLLIIGRFAPTVSEKGFYPGGLLVGASAIVFILLVAGHLTSKKEPRA
ncbi:MAG: hypothetical protein IT363_03385 [Methanoregulaceae archaeon]|jgi:uncharacterized membrane protein (UPF0136 family)|nr:hypothetical protein [Methanoregulaceae archaeon]